MGPIRNPRWEQKRTVGYVIVSNHTDEEYFLLKFFEHNHKCVPFGLFITNINLLLLLFFLIYQFTITFSHCFHIVYKLVYIYT
jgi:hypothetical protein